MRSLKVCKSDEKLSRGKDETEIFFVLCSKVIVLYITFWLAFMESIYDNASDQGCAKVH